MKRIHQLLWGLFGLLGLYHAPLAAQKATHPTSFEVHLTSSENSLRNVNQRLDALTGLPRALYHPGYPLRPDTPERMARQYLDDHQDLLGISRRDLDQLQLHAVRPSLAGTTVRLRQYLQDLPVIGAELTIHYDRERRVDFVMNGFRYDLALASAKASKSADFARQLIVERAQIKGPLIHEETSLAILDLAGEARLVHHLVLIGNDPIGEWEAYVDAQTGQIHKLEDISCYYHDHRVSISPAIPSAPPFFLVDGTGSVFDPDPLSSANASYNDPGYSDNSDNTSPQLANEINTVSLRDISYDGTNYQLVGPWAEIVDVEGPFNGLYEQPSSNWQFNRTMDGFEATNTYYHIDASMRYINDDLGIALQPTDYTGGVKFDPHGLNGADNSHYLGGTQTVTFGEGGVDDAEDSDVIHHELGHGLHDWVTNGGLSQVNGLSEGCGDYWAASYNRRLGLWNPGDAAYNWVFIWDGHNPFWNGRIVDYTATYPGGLTGAIHRDGQIWATAMIKVWDAIGGPRTDKIFWEGIGMTNSSTNQDDAANAVYAAALSLNYSLSELTAIHGALSSSGYNLPALPLPVELARFSGFQEAGKVYLEWTTASERQNAYFKVQRSADGKDFETIGKVNGRGQSWTSYDYAFEDATPLPQLNYYRLEQVDHDGSSSYSEVLAFAFAPAGIEVFPNPVQSTLTVQSDLLGAPQAEILIFDALGQLVQRQLADGKNGSTVAVNDLLPGMYTLQIRAGAQTSTVRFSK
ncbi:MAG: T9SS type A sorting domain-containing protein [Bacteroidota bacterium]